MKGFVIFAIVVTVLYIIYYTVLIVQDLYGKPKDEAVKGETFDVSDMTDEDDSVTVSENEGGFSVGESQYQTDYEGRQMESGNVQDTIAVRQESVISGGALSESVPTSNTSQPSVSVADKLHAKVDDKLEETECSFSDPVYAEELNKLLLAKGIRPGRTSVKVVSNINEL